MYDCAAGFDTIEASDIPAVISTHATKGFSTGEGGFVVSKNKKLINKVRSFINFGFNQSRISSSIGLNLKLSEVNCAYGLATLNNKEEYLTPYLEQVIRYNNLLSVYSSPAIRFNSTFIRTTYNILLPRGKTDRDEVIFKLLTEKGLKQEIGGVSHFTHILNFRIQTVRRITIQCQIIYLVDC